MFSCEFDRRACRHDSLFLGEYKRTNRTKGTKILRCFPHCCPEHVNRSYCGTALHVRVQAKRSRSDVASGHTIPVEQLYVFAHFEEVGGAKKTYATGDELSGRAVFQSLQSEQHPKGEWIQGHAHDAVDRATHVFQINPGARWYYEWESAATKAQRFTKHVLRVYVCHHDTASDTLRIVAATSSSEFTVVSYRRAPTEIAGDRRILALLAENVARQSGELGLEPDGLIASLGQKMLPFLVDSSHAKEDKKGVASPTSSLSSPYAMRPPSVLRSCGSSAREPSVGDMPVWAASHPEELAMSKRLAVLHSFLAAVPAVDFQRVLSEWTGVISSSGGSPFRAGELSSISTPPPLPSGRSELSWAFLSPLRGASPDRRALPSLRDAGLHTVDHEVDMLVNQCMQTVAWLVSDATAYAPIVELLHESARCLLDRAALRNLYLRVVTTLHRLVDRFLTTKFGSSFAQLHEDMVATLFRVDAFRGLRAPLLAQLSATSMAGLEVFVGQARQMLVELQRSHKRKREYETPSSFQWPAASSASPLVGTWRFDSQRCAVVRLTHASSPMLSVAGALECMREFATVSLALDDTASCLTLRSQLARLPSRGMALLLDGKKRVFDAWPSGVASTLPWNGLAWGDYRAQFVAADAVMMELSAWPLRSPPGSETGSPRPPPCSALRLKLCVRLTPHVDGNVLAVDGVVETARCEPCDELATLRIDRRRAAVETYAPLVQFQAVYQPAR